MANGVGVATIDFGAAPGTNIASVAVAEQAEITADALCEAWFMYAGTSDHNAYEHGHILANNVALVCGDVVAGTGFTIYATTELRLTGTITCRYVWSN